MKPSERIYQLYSLKREQEDAAHATLMAICDYLDEQYENSQIKVVENQASVGTMGTIPLSKK